MTQISRENQTVVKTLGHAVHKLGLSRDSTVLAVGASDLDLEILKSVGFDRISSSNLDGFGGHCPLDLEDLALADDSYDIVFAHAVLHHCRSPHKAAGEMARVCRRCLIFIEPNESAFLRLLTFLDLSFPYEIGAVSANNYVRGGMRNGPVPNFIHRWNRNELLKTLRSYVPERQWKEWSVSYWDFFINEVDLEHRKHTKLRILNRMLGPVRVIKTLRVVQRFMNVLPLLRSQGNKFLGIGVKGDYHPWINLTEGKPHLARNPELYGEPTYH